MGLEILGPHFAANRWRGSWVLAYFGESYGTAEDMLDAHAMVQRRLQANRVPRPILA
jgi:hypothetical protein